MTDYTELIRSLRCENTGDDECGSSDCPYWSGLGCMDGQLMEDAADAIEALRAQLPKRGHWEPVPDAEGRPYKYVCSNCHRFHVNEDEWYGYCPNCGAVMGVPIMDGPIITPCRGCSDYDGYGGCKSKGGCARAKMEVQDGSSR